MLESGDESDSIMVSIGDGWTGSWENESERARSSSDWVGLTRSMVIWIGSEEVDVVIARTIGRVEIDDRVKYLSRVLLTFNGEFILKTELWDFGL